MQLRLHTPWEFQPRTTHNPTITIGIGKVGGMRLNLRSPQLSIVCIHLRTLLYIQCYIVTYVATNELIVTGNKPRPDPERPDQPR